MSFAKKSPWVLYFGGAGCNGCGAEVMAAFNGDYGLEKDGFKLTNNPKHADILLLTGGVNNQNRDVIKQLYEQMVEPKAVLAVGDCACDGGLFKDGDNIVGGMEKVVTVDHRIPGCAPDPESLVAGLKEVLEVFDEKATDGGEGEE